MTRKCNGPGRRVSSLWFESRRGAGSAADGHYAMRRGEPSISLPLPEVREMVAAAVRYLNGEIHFSYLVGPTTDCRYWAKVYGLHPAIQQLASDWSLWVDQVWNEWGQHKESLPESELRRRIAADLGVGQPAVA